MTQRDEYLQLKQKYIQMKTQSGGGTWGVYSYDNDGTQDYMIQYFKNMIGRNNNFDYLSMIIGENYINNIEILNYLHDGFNFDYYDLLEIFYFFCKKDDHELFKFWFDKLPIHDGFERDKILEGFSYACDIGNIEIVNYFLQEYPLENDELKNIFFNCNNMESLKFLNDKISFYNNDDMFINYVKMKNYVYARLIMSEISYSYLMMAYKMTSIYPDNKFADDLLLFINEKYPEELKSENIDSQKESVEMDIDNIFDYDIINKDKLYEIIDNDDINSLEKFFQKNRDNDLIKDLFLYAARKKYICASYLYYRAIFNPDELNDIICEMINIGNRNIVDIIMDI